MFPKGVDYIFTIAMTTLGAPVSSLYGAPLLFKKGGGSHGIAQQGFTVIPGFFIPKFLLEAAELMVHRHPRYHCATAENI